MDPQWFYIYLTIVLAAIPQIAIGIWWASSLHTRVKQTEQNDEYIFDKFDTINTLHTRVSVIETGMQNIEKILEEIRDELRDARHGK